MEPVTARHPRNLRWDDAKAGIARSLEGRSPIGGACLSTHTGTATESAFLVGGPDTPSSPVGPGQIGRRLWTGHQAAVRSVPPHCARLRHGASDAPRDRSGPRTVCEARARSGGIAAM